MAQARPRRTQRTDDDEFTIPLADALALLLAPGHIQAGVSWHFRVDGSALVITRSGATVTRAEPE